VPFGCSIGVLVLAFYGLAYSVFPYLVVDQLTLWQAASSVESLWVIFIGAAVVLPVIAGYTVYAYRVFSGKARALEY
jgi:cytochrome d ubiquinol oxidase subunit II